MQYFCMRNMCIVKKEFFWLCAILLLTLFVFAFCLSYVRMYVYIHTYMHVNHIFFICVCASCFDSDRLQSMKEVSHKVSEEKLQKRKKRKRDKPKTKVLR